MTQRILFILFAFTVLVGCAEAELAAHVAKQVPVVKSQKSKGTFKVGNPYKIQGKWYRPSESYSLTETGIASWYGPNFHGKRTANGETFDKYELTAAHRTLQLPSLVRVTNLENGRSLVVRVNDRGPFSKGRIIDLSERSAELLGFKMQGTAKVKLQVLKQESLKIAEMARNGHSTAGTEIALNEKWGRYQKARQQEEQERGSIVPPSKPQQGGVHMASLQPSNGRQAAALRPIDSQPLTPFPVQGHVKRGAFYPDPVVQKVPVTPSTIFVQTGSFSSQDNAVRLAQELRAFGSARVKPALVNGKTFYRVQIPASNVGEADVVLGRLSQAGKDALIVVE